MKGPSKQKMVHQSDLDVVNQTDEEAEVANPTTLDAKLRFKFDHASVELAKGLNSGRYSRVTNEYHIIY